MTPRSTARAASRPATPKSLGYAMPAEWERHAATWLAWPHDPDTWPDRVPQVEKIFLQLIEALTPGEDVHLLVKDAATERRVEAALRRRRVDGCRIHRISTADSWIRDYGPIFLRRRVDGRAESAYLDWRFNAWGNKYESLKADDDVPRRLQPLLQRPMFEPDLVLEGGSIEVNGDGTLLTTEQCLLNPNRNPGSSREQIEHALGDYLGVEKVLWLREGIEGDDTDGHIDDVARFVDPTTIVCAVEEDETDSNAAILRANLERLRSMTDARGRRFKLVALPMPGRVEGADGRLPASYANFYVANQVVLLPVFGHANDAEAERVLRGLFPTRRVVPINCEPLVWGLGTIHCVTQQQPAEE